MPFLHSSLLLWSVVKICSSNAAFYRRSDQCPPCPSDSHVHDHHDHELISYLSGGHCDSSAGKEFVYAFMANNANPKWGEMSPEIWFLPLDESTETTVDIQLGMDNSEQKMPLHKASNYDVPPEYRMTDQNTSIHIEKKSIRIQADEPMNSFGINKKMFSADGYLSIPVEGLGRKYVVSCHWPPTYNCQFAIAGMKSKIVKVRITLPRKPAENTYKNYPDGTRTCQVSIPQGKIWEIRADEVMQVQDSCDLTGTIIEIVQGELLAVWSGNSRTYVGSSNAVTRDHVVEQLLPIRLWGEDCIASPTPQRKHNQVDYWTLTSGKDKLAINAKGLTTGETKTYRFEKLGDSVRIMAKEKEWIFFSSDGPFQAVKYSPSSQVAGDSSQSLVGDPAMTICVPTKHKILGDIPFVVPETVVGNSKKYQSDVADEHYNDFVTIIVDEGDEDKVTINGEPFVPMMDNAWVNIPTIPPMKGSWSRLVKKGHIHFYRISITGKPNARYIGYLYGDSDRESYGYPIGACFTH